METSKELDSFKIHRPLLPKTLDLASERNVTSVNPIHSILIVKVRSTQPRLQLRRGKRLALLRVARNQSSTTSLKVQVKISHMSGRPGVAERKVETTIVDETKCTGMKRTIEGAIVHQFSRVRTKARQTSAIPRRASNRTMIARTP